MKRQRTVYFTVLVLFILSGMALSAQSANDSALPVTRIALFSSGVGYFEHTGNVSGKVTERLVFDPNAINDVLKSLVINDPESTNPSVTYDSEDTLFRTLKSLKIDLSSNPGVAEILGSLRGAEVCLYAPDPITGKILGVEHRQRSEESLPEAFVSVVSPTGIRVVALKDVSSFSFTDKGIADDLDKALSLLVSAGDVRSRFLSVNLPGTGKRNITLAYVIPSPVWKASYRLDLSVKKPRFQGWAIVDNTGDSDWNNVELSLVNGRPVSFIQNLYPPYYFSRPVLPLAIAGAASADVYESGYTEANEAEYMADKEAAAPMPSMKASRAAPMAMATGAAPASLSGQVETAAARAAGDLFLFTVKKPVSLARHQSAMIPLVDTTLEAEKKSVFSGGKALAGGMIHPMLCAELTNTSGMKLPAGPITVFDGGSYAGDALIEFFPEGDKRLIAFGEDLAVSGSVSANTSSETVSVKISKGVMTISRKTIYTKIYSFRNAGASAKKMVLEHPFLQNASLQEPAKSDEKTDSLYRFNFDLPVNAEKNFTVKEQSPVQETIRLSQLGPEAFLFYGSSGEIPANIKTALVKAAELRKAIESAKAKLGDLETQKNDTIAEQERIRLNLEAAGSDSVQGKEYLKKLSSSDSEIESLSGAIIVARKVVLDAQTAYDTYLSGLTI
jgi:hypothetical protein